MKDSIMMTTRMTHRSVIPREGVESDTEARVGGSVVELVIPREGVERPVVEYHCVTFRLVL